jgi:hypothetical protein
VVEAKTKDRNALIKKFNELRANGAANPKSAMICDKPFVVEKSPVPDKQAEE